jgi:Flp pilus assembly protein TadD
MMHLSDSSSPGGGFQAARWFFAGVLALGLSSCQDLGSNAEVDAAASAPSTTPTVTGQDPADVKYYRSDEPRRLGFERFSEGNFGLAEQYFQDAVAKSPKDVAAWIGLAASYDRLGRFDLADRAYRSAVGLGGTTTQILNNEGYSYMLRGDLTKARAKFRAALQREPNNQTIVNNLLLLDSSVKYVSRSPE